jgi:hypothetical protein
VRVVQPLPPERILEALELLASNGVPAPETAPLLDVGTAEYMDYFDAEILDGFVTRGGATCRLFEGQHGAGKSHLLSLIQNHCLRRGMAVVRTTLSEALKLEDWKAVVTYILSNLQVERGGKTYRGLARVLEALREAGGINAEGLQNARVPHGGFREAMMVQLGGASYLSGEAREKLRRYLHGERVGAAELRKLGVSGVKAPLSGRNAEQVLSTVLNGLFHLRVPGTVLLFDETENTFKGANSSRKVIVSANLIRRLVDACASGDLMGALVVFAVLPGFLNSCGEAYPALGQRLQMPARDSSVIGWRSPVLPLSAVNTARDAESFLNGAVAVFERLIRACDAASSGSISQMREAGDTVLRTEVGSGYRRPLMKNLAAIACRHIR